MREEKQLLLDEIKEKIEESCGFVALNYRNFTAARVRGFRDQMSELGGDFEVVRKRVFIKAAASVGVHFDVKALNGHVGVLFAQKDATQLVKGAVKFGESNENALTLLGGHIEGEVCTAADVEAIAKLPGIREMRAQILALFEAPMAQTAQILQAVLTAVPYCLEEKSNKS